MSLEKSITEVDELKLYFGKPCQITQYISIQSPTMGDLINRGEGFYFGVLHQLTAIPSDMKAKLWDDMNVYWTDITDFEFFCLLTRGLTPKETGIFLGDLDLSSLEYGIDTKTQEVVLYKNLENGENIVINEQIYQHIVSALRTIHNIVPKKEKAQSDSMKKLLIDLNREEIEMAASKKVRSTLLPLISSMVNSPGFKYDIFSIENVPYFTFMDSVERIPTITTAMAMLSGIYGGWVDTSKLDKNQLNWMRDLRKEAKQNQNMKSKK